MAQGSQGIRWGHPGTIISSCRWRGTEQGCHHQFQSWKTEPKMWPPVSAGTWEGPCPHHLSLQRPGEGEGNWSPQNTQDSTWLSWDPYGTQSPLPSVSLPRDAPKSPRALPTPHGDPGGLYGTRAPAWPARWPSGSAEPHWVQGKAWGQPCPAHPGTWIRDSPLCFPLPYPSSAHAWGLRDPPGPRILYGAGDTMVLLT